MADKTEQLFSILDGKTTVKEACEITGIDIESFGIESTYAVFDCLVLLRRMCYLELVNLGKIEPNYVYSIGDKENNREGDLGFMGNYYYCYRNDKWEKI